MSTQPAQRVMAVMPTPGGAFVAGGIHRGEQRGLLSFSQCDISRMSQLSSPCRSTSDLGSGTVAMGMLPSEYQKTQTEKIFAKSADLLSHMDSNDSIDMNKSESLPPYPKAQIDTIYAKNANLLRIDSNDSLYNMLDSEGGGMSDGGEE